MDIFSFQVILCWYVLLQECSDMDLYITDSLQDMLDMDIKNEIATDLSSITDFSVSTFIVCILQNFKKIRIW